ncbi:MAG TPA: hypothetical protein PLB67_16175 [Candidatus Hydrogenedentes bacterium]|nr:DUF4292 domain-containing protein [Candidatus Hydrogenedentota bacterium]MDY0032457.1 hypothetical protein [FCB group bacterium]NLT62079.1 DUF4292 domain-containing protein [Candidatus Hydrogenedentota bacterium]HNV22902.1 hypothetical protein [Candidatus Hydrogenedentota bacterium]HNZ17975.1 hypothetical protein [Candidatus Hydrogenedentota bacterium]
MKRIARWGAAAFVVAVCCGCAHAPGRMLWRGSAPLDPKARVALRALADTQTRLESLRAQGVCIAAAPELVGKRKFNVTVLYRAPGDLAVRGFDSTGMSGQWLRLVVVDGRLDAEVPGLALDPAGMLGRAPADSIARELFRQEDWANLSDRRVRVIEENAGHPERLTLLVDKQFGLLRRVVLEGPEWTLRQSELLDRNGDALLRVTWDEYAEKDGVRVPAAFETVFPKRGLSLKFSLTTSKIVCNPELVSGDFVQQHEDAT